MANTIALAREVVATKQHKGGLDLFSATAIVTVADALKTKGAILALDNMNVLQAARICMNLCKVRNDA